MKVKTIGSKQIATGYSGPSKAIELYGHFAGYEQEV